MAGSRSIERPRRTCRTPKQRGYMLQHFTWSITTICNRKVKVPILGFSPRRFLEHHLFLQATLKSHLSSRPLQFRLESNSTSYLRYNYDLYGFLVTVICVSMRHRSADLIETNQCIPRINDAALHSSFSIARRIACFTTSKAAS